MLNPTDETILQSRGITTSQIEEQLKAFVTGFPYLEIRSAAEPGKGIIQFTEKEVADILSQWENYLQTDATIIKFVPASGAASRMFKDLFEFLESEKTEPGNKFEVKFFDEIHKFAFFEELNAVCIKNNGKSIDKLIASKQYKAIVANLLMENGLNYGSLPKGLLRFHSYVSEKRTPMQEHLVEGALYAANKSNKVNIHFTVSKEHRALFEKHLNESIAKFEKSFGVKYEIGFSEQKPSTDTIAVNGDNQPFRDKDELVFRPGGHGALIENLNDLNGDVIFIKNKSQISFEKSIKRISCYQVESSNSYLRNGKKCR